MKWGEEPPLEWEAPSKGWPRYKEACRSSFLHSLTVLLCLGEWILGPLSSLVVIRACLQPSNVYWRSRGLQKSFILQCRVGTAEAASLEGQQAPGSQPLQCEMPFWVAQPIFYMIFKIFFYNICTFCQFHYSKGFRFSSVSPKRLRGGDSGNHKPIGQKALIQDGAVERVMT